MFMLREVLAVMIVKKKKMKRVMQDKELDAKPNDIFGYIEW